MNRFLRIPARLVSAFVLALCTLVAPQIHAQTTPEVTRGLQWLSGQIQANGSLLNEPQSIATKLQTRTEAAQTLKLLATLPGSVTTGIDSDPEDNTEFISRKILVLASNGWDVTSYINLLVKRQNATGGFGGGVGYESNVLDTGWAVLALAQANQGTTDVAVRARAYLVSQQLQDGGMDGRSDVTRLQNSAISLLALQTSTETVNANAIRLLLSSLLQRQAADGSWGANLYLTAYVLAAVSPLTADLTVRANARQFLISKQNADGSWSADPFLTAVVLRALSGQSTPVVVTGSTLQGQLVDKASNAALAGVSVTVAGTPNKVMTTDASGKFAFTGLAAGTYSVTYLRSAYAGASANYVVNSGQTFDAGIIGLSQLSTTAIIRGQITAALTNTVLSGVQVSLSGSSVQTVSTDANGRYELIVATPGAFSITASLTGYQSAKGTGTTVAGTTVIFSPAMYSNSQTAPTTIRYFGKVGAAGQSTMLPGVAVQITGASSANAVTSAVGGFDVTLVPGSYSATFSLAGYTPVTQTFVAPAGTEVDAGIVTLSPIKSSSTIRGTVVNDKDVAIAGASVQLVGTASTVITAADGSYVLDNVAGTSISIRASATGYNAQTVSLSMAAPTNVQQNFKLVAQSSGTLNIGDLNVTPVSVGSGSDVTVTTVIKNTGTSDASAIVQFIVLNANGEIIATGIVQDASGNALGQVSLAAGGEQSIQLKWNSGLFAPGAYGLKVALAELGSITRTNPTGTLLVERLASVSIVGQAHFTGSVTSNPPVLQAGTNTAVKLSALIRNDGNKPIVAQNYTLNVIDTKDASVVLTQQAPGAAMAINGLQILQFADWTPTIGGSFRLEVTAADTTLGKVVGTLYVGDSAKATYSVNKLVVPTGTQTVRASVKVTGQDVTTGTISDPLAPIIKAAVQKAMTFNYAVAAQETVSDRCLRCHVQTQALVGGELTRTLTNYNEFKNNRDIILNSLTTYQQSDGAIDGHTSAMGQFRRAESMLGMWALNTWHEPAEIASTLAKGAKYLADTQSADGSWYSDYAQGWWAAPVATSAFNAKSMIDASKILKQVPAGSARTFSTVPLTTQPLNGPFNLTTDAAGNVYSSNYYTNDVQIIKPDGSLVPFMTNIDRPEALIFTSDGTAYLAAVGGLYRRTPDGTVKQLSSILSSSLAIGPDGNVYMSSYWSNAIFRVTPEGTVTPYISGGALANPWGIAFTPSGDLLVASYGGQKILRYRPDLTYDIPVGWTAGVARNLQQYKDGWLLTTDTGLFFYNADWHAERLLYTSSGGLALGTKGEILVGDISANRAYEVKSNPIDITALRSSMETPIARSTTWLLQDSNINPNDNLQLAQRLIGLNAAKGYYEGKPLANTIQAKMLEVGTLLRSRVQPNGGWSRSIGSTTSDSMVTAQVGVALDSLNPSASDPIVQNAVTWLLSRQQPAGTWYSETGILTTPLASTTWVSIWLPTVLNRLGGIDSNLSVTFPANVSMTNPDIAPSTSTNNPDGSRTVVWSLIGVTSAGQTVNYDLTLANMGIDEARSVSTDAHLTFKNTFTNTTVDAPIDIPQVKASAFLNLGVATDKLTYPSDAIVTIKGQVTNTGAAPLSGKVKFDIYAADKSLVASVGTAPFSGVAAGSSVLVGLNWNDAKTLAATGYYVVGTLYDSSDRTVGTAQSIFAITADGAGAATVSEKVTTDKQTYQPTDSVKITSNLTNLTSNTPQNNLTIITTVKGPDGAVRFTATETLPQLPASGIKNYAYTMPLNVGAAGQYAVTMVVTGPNGVSFGQSTTTFTVAASSDSGSGLTGTIAATPKQVPLGEAVVFSFKAINAGNSTLSNVPLKVTIVDPVAQKIMAEYPYSQTLNVGGNYAASASWTTTGQVGANYAVVLTATVGGKALTLAQDSFTVTAASIKLNVSQNTAAGNRVLVLVSCKEGDSEADVGGKPATCITQRSQIIHQALIKAGVPYTIVTNEVAFKQAFRSGLYNTYWISGKEDKLHDDISSEIREAAFSGDGVIIDSDHDERNKTLDVISGIRWKGKIGDTDLRVDIAGPIFDPQSLTMSGRGLKLELDGGQQQAAFNGGKPNSSGPAIIANSYGAGRAVLYAFDLPASLQSQAPWQEVLETSLRQVMPAQHATLTPGAVVPIKTTVANLARATGVSVSSTLPTGASYLGSNPTAVVDAGLATVTWAFNLAQDETKEVFLTLQAPPTTGTFTLRTVVSTVANGVSMTYGDPLSSPIIVTAAAQTSADAITALNAFPLTQNTDRKARDSMVVDLQSAMTNFNKGTLAGYDAAISQFIAVVDQLNGLTTVDTRAVHDAVDRMLKEAQWRWTQLPASPK